MEKLIGCYDDEERRFIPNTKLNYCVSSIGYVISIHKGKPRVLKAELGRCGYLSVRLYVDGGYKVRTIHSIVAEVFIGPRPSGKQVHHKNGVKTDNRRENIEYVLPGWNNHQSFVSGLSDNKGEKNPTAVLTECDVVKIRELYASGNYFQYKIAEMFGIKQPTVNDIICGRTWTHV